MFVLNLNRVYLRNFVYSDLSDMYEYCSNELVGPSAGWKKHNSIEETRGILLKLLKSQETLAIIDKFSDKCIGSIGIYKDTKRDDPNCKMVGYVLNPLYWGKGIMCESLTGLMDYLFNNTNISLLSVYHFPSNKQSKRVIEKCGFRYEGVIRNGTLMYDGTLLDNYSYSISRKEYYSWQKRNIHP